MTLNSDAIYYRHGASLPLARALLRTVRERMYRLFVAEFPPTAATTILDLGVSDEESNEANMLEKNYPYPDRITCAGLGDGAMVLSSYPGIEYIKIFAGRPLPFADKSFDIVCSNAVLEHVGGPAARQAFLREVLRVGRAAFITVPNRWFPVEHHTGIPLVHFNERLFRHVLKDTALGYWANPKNLEFLDRRLLIDEWPGPQRPKVVHAGIQLGPLSSNIALIAR